MSAQMSEEMQEMWKELKKKRWEKLFGPISFIMSRGQSCHPMMVFSIPVSKSQVI